MVAGDVDTWIGVVFWLMNVLMGITNECAVLMLNELGAIGLKSGICVAQGRLQATVLIRSFRCPRRVPIEGSKLSKQRVEASLKKLISSMLTAHS